MNRCTNRILSLAVAFASVLALAAPLPTHAQSGYTFQVIHIPNADDASVLAGGPNASGVVTGWYTGADGLQHGFLWKDGVSTPYDLPGVDATLPFTLNAAGQVVGNYMVGGQEYGFYTTPTGQVTQVNIPGMLSTFAYGINDSGVIVGSYIPPSGITNPFMLSKGQFTLLSIPQAKDYADALAINARGTIVGDYGDISNSIIQRGYMLDKGIVRQVIPPDHDTFGEISAAFSLNDHDVIVGYYLANDDNEHGFVLDHGVYARLDYPTPAPPPGYVPYAPTTVLFGINNRGQIAGFFSVYYFDPDTLDVQYVQFSFLATPTH